MCDDMDAKHACLLFYSNSLQPVYKLRNKTYSYLYDASNFLGEKFTD